MATSQNGWTVRTSSSGLASFPWVTGRVVPGDVYKAFDHLCRRFDTEVEDIRRDWSWGYAYRPIRGSSSGYSNHASGTAIDLNAPKHPLGVRYTFNAAQRQRIRAILRDFDGAIRWGGDYSGRPDEMHFEINTSAANLRRVVASLNQPAPPKEEPMPTVKQIFKYKIPKLGKRFERAFRINFRRNRRVETKVDRILAILQDEHQGE